MEKPQTSSYYNIPSAPEVDCPPPHEGHFRSGFMLPSFKGYAVAKYLPPQGVEYPQDSCTTQGCYSPSQNYPPPGGYPENKQQPYYPPMIEHQAITTATPQPYIPPKYGWWEDVRRNIPQSKALSPATFIFVSNGMALACSIGYSPIYPNLSRAAGRHMQICWFLAIILGACLSAIFVEKIKLRIFMLIASVLVLINGFLYTLATENVTAITIARYCDGIAFGLTVIPIILTGSEISVKRFRAYNLTIEQIGLIGGMNLYICYINFHLMHGIAALVCGTIALILTFTNTIESPISYLRKGNETGAVNILRQLQKPKFITAETFELFNENKCLLEEDVARGRALNISIGLVPMVKICLFRGFVSMAISVAISNCFLLTAVLSNSKDYLWVTYRFSTIRWIGLAFSVFILDTLGRKIMSGLSFLFGGVLLVGVGILLSSYINLKDSINLDIIKGLLMAYQLLAGAAAPASTCYLGEAFSISVKPYFILVAIIFENVIQIIICCTFSGTVESIVAYAYVLGVLQGAFGIFVFFGFPETKQTTLREALMKFTPVSNVGDRV